jgi:hypothetical protein
MEVSPLFVRALASVASQLGEIGAVSCVFSDHAKAIWPDADDPTDPTMNSVQIDDGTTGPKVTLQRRNQSIIEWCVGHGIEVDLKVPGIPDC